MARAKITYGRFGRKHFYIDGKEVTEREFNRAFPSKIEDLLASPTLLPAQTPTCWPMVSEALAVHPKQVEQARIRNRRHGVAVDYLPDGRAILPDRGARRDLLRIEGFRDNNGGYGD